MTPSDRLSAAESLAIEEVPRDLNFRKECSDYRCGAIKSWKEGFVKGHRAGLAEADRLAEVIAKVLSSCGQLHAPIYFIHLREALENYKRAKGES